MSFLEKSFQRVKKLPQKVDEENMREALKKSKILKFSNLLLYLAVDFFAITEKEFQELDEYSKKRILHVIEDDVVQMFTCK